MVVSSPPLNILEPCEGICHYTIAHQEPINSWLGVHNIAVIYFFKRQTVIRQWIQSKHDFVKTDLKKIFFFLEEHKNASYLLFALKSTLPNIKGSLGNKNITSEIIISMIDSEKKSISICNYERTFVSDTL